MAVMPEKPFLGQSLRLLLAPVAWAALNAGAPPLVFTPIEPRFEDSAEAYRALWEAEGARIVAALEAHAGVEFPPAPIEVLLRDGPPMTAYDGRTIRMRAGYRPLVWRATFVHELGHRLALTLGRTAELDDHRLLYLFLYDALTDLYGQDFTDRVVRMERGIPGAYDYDAAWTWALAMTREERQARLRGLRPALGYQSVALDR